MNKTGERIIDFLALFSSIGTLLCCALPALFVSLGAGAVFAGLVSNFPQITWLSRFKTEVFSFAAVMLILSALLRYLSKDKSCPVEGGVAETCAAARETNDWVFPLSIVLFAIGVFFAFVAPSLI